MIDVSDLFYRRQLWLILFGIINVYGLLWDGDFIFDYGCYGLALFVFRNVSPQKLLLFATLSGILMITRENWKFSNEKAMILKGESIAMLDTTQMKLNPVQEDVLAEMEKMRSTSSPDNKLKEARYSIRMMTGT